MKMAVAGIHYSKIYLAKLRAPMPRFITTGITPWQTARMYTADCQASRSGSKDYMRTGQACGIPLSDLDSSWQSAV
jgi:hypothetical protein